MATPKGTIFVLTITPRVCDCPPRDVVWAAGRVADRVIERAIGHWSIYSTFFEDQLPWLDFTVVDLRDGSIVWLNGQIMQRSESGYIQ